MLRIVRQLLHPIAQLRRMHAQVLRRLHIRHASIFDQAHSLKLELPRKLPPLHDAPPVPSKHQTRCLRNRVQANYRRHPIEEQTTDSEQLWRVRLRGVGLLLFGLCRRDFALPSSWNVRGLERDVIGYVKSQLEETAISSCTQAIVEAAVLPRNAETALM